MNKQPTKYYSSQQEHYISKYLGWRVVTGSGSRDCHPGDTHTFNWLGECKTHVSEKPKVVFQRRWWDKIVHESVAAHKTPVLFVDNGNSANTWVVTNATPTDSSIADLNAYVQINVSFSPEDLDKSKIYKIYNWAVGFSVPYLMSLQKFYEEFVK